VTSLAGYTKKVILFRVLGAICIYRYFCTKALLYGHVWANFCWDGAFVGKLARASSLIVASVVFLWVKVTKQQWACSQWACSCTKPVSNNSSLLWTNNANDVRTKCQYLLKGQYIIYKLHY